MYQLFYNAAFAKGDYPKSPEKFIDYAIYGNKLSNVCLLVPTGRLERLMKMKITTRYYRLYSKPVEHLPVFTFQNFVKDIYDKTYGKGNHRIISDAYRLALFEEAADATKLRFFASQGKKLSTAVLQRLSSVIFGLKEDGIEPQDLEKDLSDESVFISQSERFIDKMRLGDIHKIYVSYQRLLGDKYLDKEELLKLLCSNLSPKRASSAFDELFPCEEESKRYSLEEVFPEQPLIMLGGFSEFKLPELNMIALFADSDIPFVIHIDYNEENGPLFGNFDDTARKLAKSGFMTLNTQKKLNEQKGAIKSNNSEEIFLNQEFDNASYLRRWLFNTEKQITREELSRIIKIMPSDTRETEVMDIAKLVKHLIVNENFAPQDICIATKNPTQYSDLFREIFAECRIPIYISDRFPLAKSPCSIALFSILDVVVKGYRIEDVNRALQSKYLDFPFNEEKQRINASNLYQTATRLRIRGGRERDANKGWEIRLNDNIKFTTAYINELEKNDNAEEIDIGFEKQKKVSTELALQDFKAFSSTINIQNKKYLPEDFASIIKNDILKRFKVKEKIIESYIAIKDNSSDTNPVETAFYLEEIERDANAYSEICRLADEFAYVLSDRYQGKEFNLKDLASRFKTVVSGAKYQIREKLGFGVTVTSVEQTREIPTKVSILCGAIDGEFPLSYRPESFLGKELPETEERHIKSERMLFYQFLSNNPELLNSGEKRIYITYPKKDEQSDFVPSPFISALKKIVSSEKDALDLSPEESLWRKALITKSDVLSEYSMAKNEGFDGLSEFIKERGNLASDVFNYVNDSLKSKRDYGSARISSEKTMESEMEYFSKLDTKPYSASEIDQYAQCPFQYYSSKILRIAPPEDTIILLSPLEKGTLMHKIFYRFYKSVQEEQLEKEMPSIQIKQNNTMSRKIYKVCLNSGNKADYLEKLKSIAEDEIKNYSYEHSFFKIEKEEIFGTEDVPGLLNKWLNAEINRFENKYNYRPALFELNFGVFSGTKSPEVLLPLPMTDKFTLRGKIDRIDFSEKESFIIADYKSNISRQGNNNQVKDFKVFQMPLYALAAKKILKEHYNYEPALDGCVYLAINPKYDKNDKLESEKFLLLNNETDIAEQVGKQKYIQVLKEGENIDEILEQVLEKAVEMKTEIVNGNFPVLPDNDHCKYCKFDAFCRKAEIEYEEKEAE